MSRTRCWKGVWLVAPLLLAACATFDVSSDRYAQADFSHFHTYAWIADDPQIRPHGAQTQVSPLTARRIHEAIESELAAKGYKAASAPTGADFVVAFTVGTRDRIDEQSYPAEYRGPWLWDWYRNEPDLRVYREGTLSIDIFDGTSHQPVWHGRARKEITSSDVADPAPVIKQAVAAILRKFP